MGKITIVVGQPKCGKTATLVKRLVDDFQNNKRCLWYNFDDNFAYLNERILDEIKKRGLVLDANKLEDLILICDIPMGAVAFQNVLDKNGDLYSQQEIYGKVDTIIIDSMIGFKHIGYTPSAEILNNAYSTLRRISDECDVDFVIAVNEQLIGTVLSKMDNFVNKEEIVVLPRKVNYE